MLFPLGMDHYLIGGILIGLGVALIYVFTGIMAGASSFFSAVWSYVSDHPYFQQQRYRKERVWRSVFSLSLILGALIYASAASQYFITEVQWWRLALGGFLVGLGTRMSRGCTSGHGVCGVGALSRPSIMATATFVVVGIATALLVQSLGVLP